MVLGRICRYSIAMHIPNIGYMQKKQPTNLVDLFIICHSYPLIPYVRAAARRAAQPAVPRATAPTRPSIRFAFMRKLLAAIKH